VGALSGHLFERQVGAPGDDPGAPTWAATSIGWQYDLEHGMRAKWPGDLSHSWSLRWVWARGPEARPGFVRWPRLPTLSRVLTYHHAGLPVLGRTDLVPVDVEFHEHPTYPTYGLPWHDYPRVVGDPGAASLHRMGDGSLCLYFPWDPPHRRWRYENGLVQLFDLVADHLHKELWWRHTGGHDGGEWLGEDTDHGIPRQHRNWTETGGIPL
jgi:hypothetical protein